MASSAIASSTLRSVWLLRGGCAGARAYCGGGACHCCWGGGACHCGGGACHCCGGGGPCHCWGGGGGGACHCGGAGGGACPSLTMTKSSCGGGGVDTGCETEFVAG